jgi:hypothetical protein
MPVLKTTRDNLPALADGTDEPIAPKTIKAYLSNRLSLKTILQSGEI